MSEIEISKSELSTYRAQLAKMSADGRRGELQNHLFKATSCFMMAGVVAAAMVDAGDPRPEGVRNSMWQLFIMIGRGITLPEIVSKCTHHGAPWLKKFSMLPIDDQKTLAEDKPVRLVVRGDDNKWTHRMLRYSEIGPDQKQILDQLIGVDGIRSEKEQIMWLDRASQKSVQTVDADKISEPITVKGDYIIVRQPMKISRRQLNAYLAQMKD
jgi:hypothetical protein